ncbi:phage portal protein [Streptomyces abikoensis]|uniref:Phage portal protein n=1 Tax=Streptomyces abikoensis TaxID=97398 RepID=A0ABW7T9V8_9ACTN
MAFVVSSGQLTLTGASVLPSYAVLPIGASPWEYAQIWRCQPQVRTVVSFLARNIAQIGLHVFRRVSDTDRERLADHPLALLLAEPMPRMTAYRFIERLVSDLAVYDEAYWIKARVGERMQLLPVPPTLIRPRGGSWLAPEDYQAASGQRFALDEVVHFRGYSPEDLRHGASPVEALRALLLEDQESAKQRAAMWRSGARMTGVLTRPSDAPEWSTEEKRRFREMWRTFAAGGGAEGGTPILEDGMAYTPIAMSPEQAQYIEARKLTREEVAAAYHIPPPLVGILDHATYSNITEQHKILYQDTLGPWLQMIQQEIKVNLLPDLPDSQGVYVEFNIAEKMRGSFEEQAAAASTATGRPWMTVNEQRARFNLPQIDGGDSLITPLNVTDPAAAPKARGLARTKAARPDELGTFPDERDALTEALARWTRRQAGKLLAAAGAKDDGMPDLLTLWAAGRKERLAQLEALLADHGYRLAQVGAWEVLGAWNAEAEGWSADVMLAWVLAAAETHAAQHEEAGRKAVAAVAEEGGEQWREHLVAAAGAWEGVSRIRSTTAATELRSFGGHDAAGASGLKQKTWRTGGKNPRPSHRAQDGESVGLDDVFSNGLRWPGDGHGKAKETSNCNCTLDYARGD